MKTYSMIGSFIIGVILIVVGISLGGLQQMPFIGDVSFIRNPLKQPDMIYRVDSALVSQICDLSIDTSHLNVTVVEKDIRHIEVNAENVYEGLEIYQKGNELIIKQPKYINYHDEPTYIEIDIPQNFEFQNAQISGGMGQSHFFDLKAHDIEIDNYVGDLLFKNITADTVKVGAAMGQTTVDDLVFSQDLEVNVGMGNAQITVIHDIENYSFDVNVGLGEAQINQYNYSGVTHTKIHGNRSGGTIKVNVGMGNVDIQGGMDYE